MTYIKELLKQWSDVNDDIINCTNKLNEIERQRSPYIKKSQDILKHIQKQVSQVVEKLSGKEVRYLFRTEKDFSEFTFLFKDDSNSVTVKLVGCDITQLDGGLVKMEKEGEVYVIRPKAIGEQVLDNV